MTPAALLLDLDGTLVDSEPIHRAAYTAYFGHRGWELLDLSLFTGRRAEDVFATEPGPWTGLDPDELAAEVTAFVPEGAFPEPVPGARELVLAAELLGIPVGLVTSAGPAWVSLTLGRVLGVHDRFAVVVTADQVILGKPHPDGYRLAAGRLGVDASGCLVVEDSPAGVRAALDAGISQVYAVSTTHPAASLVSAGAVDVHPDLWPVVALL